MVSRAAEYDAVIVGAGPNGLTAGVVLARAGLKVLVLEANDEPGGGCRSAELTLPGYVHDVCAAVHPLGIVSPAFREIGLEQYGLEWSRAERPLAHPLPNGDVAQLDQSIAQTARALGADGGAWERLMTPFATPQFVQSLLRPVWWPEFRNMWTRLRFGLSALRSCESLVRTRFEGTAARALFAGCAAHSLCALDEPGTAAFGLVLALAGHAIDWPCARGGSQQIVRTLVRALEKHGGQLVTGTRVTGLRDVPDARAVLLDLSPRQVAAIAGDVLPRAYCDQLRRFRVGPGVFKVDWALDGPIPWRNPACASAMTVHVRGTCEEIARAEADVVKGRAPEHPFVLVAQQSLFDPTRAPAGRHTGWAYCHVPHGCTEDMTSRIENAIERFAPGFRDRILARHSISPAQLEQHNATMHGGDIAGGRNNLRQALFRPALRWNPYRTPHARIFLCSSSTPPGGGVHGMCGYLAAQTVLKRVG